MERIQETTRAIGVGSRTQAVGPVLIAVAIAAVVASSMIAWSLNASSSRGTVVGIGGDPLVQPAAVEFRASEHSLSVSQTDPLLQPAAIDFRAGEHSTTVTTEDPLLQPNAIEFRANEHAAGGSR